MAAHGLAFDMAFARLNLMSLDLVDDVARGGDGTEGDALDGIPEWFVGPLLSELVCHEVGHTIGLRHNFKASTIHSIQEINTESFKGRPQTGSVMDYNPININMQEGEVQGDFAIGQCGA